MSQYQQQCAGYAQMIGPDHAHVEDIDRVRPVGRSHHNKGYGDVAGLSYGGVSQYAPHIVLPACREVSKGHGHSRQYGEGHVPLQPQCHQGDDDHPEGSSESHLLGAGCQQSADQGRCALIGIRSPHVEGNQSHLEGESDDDEYQSHQCSRTEVGN